MTLTVPTTQSLREHNEEELRKVLKKMETTKTSKTLKRLSLEVSWYRLEIERLS